MQKSQGISKCKITAEPPSPLLEVRAYAIYYTYLAFEYMPLNPEASPWRCHLTLAHVQAYALRLLSLSLFIFGGLLTEQT